MFQIKFTGASVDSGASGAFGASGASLRSFWNLQSLHSLWSLQDPQNGGIRGAQVSATSATILTSARIAPSANFFGGDICASLEAWKSGLLTSAPSKHHCRRRSSQTTHGRHMFLVVVTKTTKRCTTLMYTSLPLYMHIYMYIYIYIYIYIRRHLKRRACGSRSLSPSLI